MRKLKFGELSAVVTGGSDGQGGGEGPLFVLLHGFGAPGADLVPLAGELDVPNTLRFVFPMAPLVLEPGVQEDFAARAWWMIDMAALQVATMTRQYEALTRHEPEGLPRAKSALLGLLEAAEHELGAAPERTVIGGFSQGAMLACATVFTSDRPFAGLAILSGMLMGGDAWQPGIARRRGLPIFQSHGTSDPVLPFAAAEMLSTRLREGGLDVDHVAFPGGHGIPEVVLGRLSAFVRRSLENRS